MEELSALDKAANSLALTGETFIGNLPCDIFQAIVRELPETDTRSCMLVCKWWKHAIYADIAHWQTIRLHSDNQISRRRVEFLQDRQLQSGASNCTYRLFVKGECDLSVLTDTKFNSVCSHISALYYKGNPSQCLSLSMQLAPSLRYATIHLSLSPMPSQSFEQLLASAPLLETLNFHDIGYMDPVAYRSASTSNINTLNVTYQSSPPLEYPPQSLQLNCYPHLKSLHLTQHPVNWFIFSLKNAPSLKTLILVDICINSELLYFPELCRLSIKNQGWARAEWASLPLGGDNNMVYPDLEIIILKYVILDFSELNTLYQYSTKLRVVDLEYVRGIQELDLIAAIRVWENLETLKVRNVFHITIQLVLALQESSRYLKQLTLGKFLEPIGSSLMEYAQHHIESQIIDPSLPTLHTLTLYHIHHSDIKCLQKLKAILPDCKIGYAVGKTTKITTVAVHDAELAD